jgi:hypothetical protein
MHAENDQVEFVTIDDQEYEDIVKEYEERSLCWRSSRSLP